MAARMLVALYWKSDFVPCKDKWLQKVWHVLLMNNLTAINKYRFGDLKAVVTFINIWIIFVNYWRISKPDNNDILPQVSDML